ncbi:hypothetical protein PTSG_02996 [Salpingoeca rosetta]|uniref:Uncharacterized protein n=1 Tax=Salpingoeca rosetta (strain ATCC 50818 / BSB-021) TaxID=946362 RepID=F2U3Y9_SALR5|nr:uncharacterized protein PTSG_02996 [Salpingoeca rosetta]EGD82333.1 hypothetical protein PTSG_02996 [Salpingoeca rosetta]|eukprot:XP_004996516.1 hypothetical protein PTSG_02996 [Salpingoeca rosetta]
MSSSRLRSGKGSKHGKTPLLRDERPLIRRERSRRRDELPTRRLDEVDSKIRAELRAQQAAHAAMLKERGNELESENMQLMSMVGILQKQIGQFDDQLETQQKKHTTTVNARRHDQRRASHSSLHAQMLSANARLRRQYHELFEAHTSLVDEHNSMRVENEELKSTVSRLRSLVDDLHDASGRASPSPPRRSSPSRLETKERQRALQKKLYEMQTQQIEEMQAQIDSLQKTVAEQTQANQYLQDERDRYRQMLDDAHAEREDLVTALDESRQLLDEAEATSSATTQETNQEASRLKIRLTEAEAELNRTHEKLAKSVASANAAHQHARQLEPYRDDLTHLLKLSSGDAAVLEEIQHLRAKYLSEALHQHTSTASRAATLLHIDKSAQSWDALLDQAEEFARVCETLDEQRLETIDALVNMTHAVSAPSPRHKTEFIRELQRLARPDVPDPILDSLDEILRLERSLAVHEREQKHLEHQYHHVSEKCKAQRPHYIEFDGAFDLLTSRLEELETQTRTMQQRMRYSRPQPKRQQHRMLAHRP